MTKSERDQLLSRASRGALSPDSTNAATDVTVNGLRRSMTTKTGLTYLFEYDALGRQTGVIDPRTGRAVTQYDDKGRIAWTEDAAGNRTTYTYDETTGRRIAVTDAMTNTTHTAYDLQGHVIATWGATYPVAYEYDPQGRMTAMYTYRGTNILSSQSQIANCKSQMDCTSWQYDSSSGLLTNKTYADGKGVTYTYDASGRLASRRWARGVVTEYAYDALGQLTNINYSDTTPDVAFTYDRLGRQQTITDALGTRTNAYADTLELTEEQLPDGTTLYRAHDSLGRPSALSIGNRNSAIGNYSVSYGYDNAGRFSSVSSFVNSASFVVEYSYLENSDLLAGYTNSSGFAVERVYEPDRNLIASIENRFGAATISSFAYENDAIGRRTQRIDTDSTTNAFGYNIRSELIEAIMGTNQFGYLYDPIGNRKTASCNSEISDFTANELNQYTFVSNRHSALGNPTTTTAT